MPNEGAIPFFNPPRAIAQVEAQALANEMRVWQAQVVEHFADGKKQPITSSGKRGEELFHLILSGIREIYGRTAIIAGGAVRDVAAGITNHKDVDVFVPMKWKTFNDQAEELGWAQLPLLLPQPKAYKNEGAAFKSTARATAMVQNCVVDMIFLEDPLSKETVDKFPIHAQRCVWTLDKGMGVSPEAEEDIKNKQFTIDPTITDKDKVQKLISKINEWKKRPEYKDWKIVEPEVKDWWEEAKLDAPVVEVEKPKNLFELYHLYWNGQINLEELRKREKAW